MSEFVNPNEVLEQLDLKKDMTAVDFGCGAGSWVIPLSKILEDGLIFAIDVQETALSALEANLKLHKITNIRKILGDVEYRISALKDSSYDLVLMTNLLFQAEDKKAVFEEAYRVLKKNSILLVVDWTEESSLGPSISKAEIRNMGKETGFQIQKEFSAGDYHFAIIFKK